MTQRAVLKALLLASSCALALSACGNEDEPRFRPGSREHAEATGAVGAPPHAAELPIERPPVLEEEPTADEAPIVPAQDRNPALLLPAAATQQAPATFAVELTTDAGPIVIDVTRAWAPNGADRFYNLVQIGFFTDVAFFRVVSGFMAQGGIHGDPRVAAAWRSANIPDDPVVQSNRRGFVTFAMGGPNTRTTQFFINLVDNQRLDPMGFPPFGRVRDMAAVDALHSGYGESAPGGRGPMQQRIQTEGNAYLRAEFPQLSYIRSARIL